MANLNDDITTALVAKIGADAWFANPANCRTLTDDVPESLFPTEEFTECFRTSDMPAVGVLAGLEKTGATGATTGELRHEVPVKLVGVLVRTRKKDAWAAANEMLGQLLRVLQAVRTSANRLNVSGRGNFIRTAGGIVDVVRGEGVWYGLLEADATVVVQREC